MRTPTWTLALATLAPLTAAVAAQTAGEIVIDRSITYDVGGLEVPLEIGHMLVPENREVAGSRLIKVAYGRFRSPAAEPGSPLVYLSGGPGSSASAMARNPEAMAAWRPVLEVCDLILLDQRATGHSTPSLQWRPDEPPPTDVLLDEARARQVVLDLARSAATHLRDQGIDLAGYTTVQSADDIDDLRAGLGLDRISLFGFSYGTHLALATIRRHGEHLDKVILIGTEGPDQTFKLPSNADTQLRKLSLLVADDPVVGPYVPDLVGLLRRVLDKLEKQPVTVTVTDPLGNPYEVQVGRFGLQLILRFDLGDASDLVVFPKLLWSIDQGDPSVLQ